MTDARVTDAVVEQLAVLGPFFAVEAHDRGSTLRDPWRPMTELVEQPAVLLDRVLAVRARLAAAGGQAPEGVELRVAASVTHLGLVARLISPALAAAVTLGALLDLDLHNIRWQPTLGGPFPMSIPRDAGPASGQRPPQQLAARLAAQVLDGPIRDLGTAAGVLSVSPHVLWGNVASAVNGAATMIVTSAPAYAGRTRGIATALLDQPPLRGLSTGPPGPGFRRRSCCLIYRSAPDAAGPVCGDCVLAGRTGQQIDYL